MKIEINTKSIFSINSSLMIWMNALYLVGVFCLVAGLSPFESFVIHENWGRGIFWLACVLAFAIYLNRLDADERKRILGWYFLLVCSVTAVVFLVTMNKIVLGFFLFQMILNSIFYYYMFSYFDLAVLNPLFDETYLLRTSSLKVPLELIVGEEVVAKGDMTNWDLFGCFVALDSELPQLKEIIFKLEFENVREKFTAQVITRANQSAGLWLAVDSDQFVKWRRFVEILKDRGY